MSERIRLVEFQRRLIQRLQETPGAVPVASLLAIEAGTDRFLCDIHELSEVMPVPALLPAPHPKPWFRGLAYLRGAFYGIVDLAALRETGDVTPITCESRILLTRAGAHAPFGVLVSRVLGLKRPEEATGLGPEPSGPSWRSQGHRGHTGPRWAKLELARLAGHWDLRQASA